MRNVATLFIFVDYSSLKTVCCWLIKQYIQDHYTSEWNLSFLFCCINWVISPNWWNITVVHSSVQMKIQEFICVCILWYIIIKWQNIYRFLIHSHRSKEVLSTKLAFALLTVPLQLCWRIKIHCPVTAVSSTAGTADDGQFGQNI
jgi:hypothetical protein